MRIDYKELKKYPDVMNKEQLRVVCHISKRTALYLLTFNLIPNETTGKKTRCYKIKKSDVIAFMKDREVNPSKYIAPENWYQYSGKRVKSYKIRLVPDLPNKNKLREYYEAKLLDYQDVIDVNDIVAFTGYNRRTVGEWIRSEKLRGLLCGGKYNIPKCYFLDWLCSDEYNNIIRKSEKHTNTLWDITQL